MPTFSPRRMLQKKLMMNGICARPITHAAIEIGSVPMETAQAPHLLRGESPALAAIVPAAVHPEHALQKHRQENHVHADERGPEMDLAPEVVHLSPGRFREPIIDAGEDREDRSRRHDVMEMRDHVIGVVQVKISAVEGQRYPRQAADPEHRQERGREEHRHGKANRSAPKRDEKRAQDDDRWDRDDHRRRLEKRAHRRAHAGQPHVVGPDDEGEKPENQRGEHERLVTPERLARVVRDDLRDNPHARQNQHVNFRVPEEPKEMLPEERAAAAADLKPARRSPPARSAKRSSSPPPDPSAA